MTSQARNGSRGATVRLAATVFHTLSVIDGALRIRLERVDLLECETALPSVQLFV